MKLDATATMNVALRAVLRRLHYPFMVMHTRVRGYVAYPLSFRQIEEIMDAAEPFYSLAFSSTGQ